MSGDQRSTRWSPISHNSPSILPDLPSLLNVSPRLRTIPLCRTYRSYTYAPSPSHGTPPSTRPSRISTSEHLECLPQPCGSYSISSIDARTYNHSGFTLPSSCPRPFRCGRTLATSGASTSRASLPSTSTARRSHRWSSSWSDSRCPRRRASRCPPR